MATATPADARPTAPASRSRHRSPSPPRVPAFLLGIGLGGFVDGILMHQILQWHHLLSDEGDFPTDTVGGLQDNIVADGLFHAATWLFVFVGMLATVRAWQRGRLAPPWRAHVGMLLVGLATFNVVEGVIDHQLLGIHHVRDDLGGPLSWDIGFLVVSAAVGLVGAALARSGERQARGRGDAGRDAVRS